MKSVRCPIDKMGDYSTVERLGGCSIVHIISRECASKAGDPKVKCLVTNGQGDLSLSSLEEPIVRYGMVIVKVSYASICGSDFSIINGTGPAWTSYPIVPGHEFSGVVVEVGEGVSNVAIGDRVVIDNYLHCGSCYYCKKGEYFFCDSHREVGFTINGGYAEYCLVPYTSVVKVPRDMPLKHAVLAEPTGTCMKACVDCNMREGEVVIILGCGPIAGMCAMICSSLGAKVIVLGRGSRLNRFANMGCELLLDTTREDWADTITRKYGVQTRTWGLEAVDVVIDATQTGELIYEAMTLLRRRARVLLLGLKEGQQLQIPRNEVVLKDVRIIGSVSGRGYFWEALKLLQDRTVDAEKIITHVFPLEEGPTAFEFISNRSEGSLKVAIDNCS